MPAAIDFLLTQQLADGAWRDFQLAAGQSDAWVTAYVGLSLLDVPEFLKTTDRTAAITRAALWLLAHTGGDHGWGYNGLCPTDADSTAYAVLFLTGCDYEVPSGTYETLLSFQQPDGGFATYHPMWPGDSWGVSHADVTSVAIRALLSWPLHTRWRVRASKFVSSRQSPEGVWHSFWWQSPYYSTLMNLQVAMSLKLRFDRERLVEHLCQAKVESAFEQALLVQCLLTLDLRQEVVCHVSALLAAQEADGSWRSGPILRQPYRICQEPWRVANAGDIYEDQNRLFTTATVLEALARFGAPAEDALPWPGTSRVA